MPEPIEKDPVMGPSYECALKEAVTLRDRIHATMEAYAVGDDARDKIDDLLRELLPYLAKMSYYRGCADGMKEIVGGL